jgi:hypothetical protein
VVLSQLSQKLMRVLRKADKKAENRPALKQKLDDLRQLWGVEPKSLHQHLKQLGPRQAAQFINQHKGLLNQLTEVKMLVGSEHMPVLSDHEDEIRERNQTNKDIAASIIGHSWTPAQRKWLDRLAIQLVHEVIIDRDFVNHRFAEDGGAKRMDKVLGGSAGCGAGGVE